jgi:hypothetical protein
MVSKFTSPYATSFKTGIKKGMTCGMIVNAISKRTGKSVGTIYVSLYKAGLCTGQKINGQWIYWPTMKTRTSKTNATMSKTKMWQCFVDWCISSGTWTNTQITKKSMTSKAFATFCKNWFGKTVTTTGMGKAKTTKSKKARKNTKKRRITMSKRGTVTTKHTRKVGKNKAGRKSWTTARFTTKWNKNSKNTKNTKRTAKTTRRPSTKVYRTSTWNTRNYKFPVLKTRYTTTTRRYSRAA